MALRRSKNYKKIPDYTAFHYAFYNFSLRCQTHSFRFLVFTLRQEWMVVCGWDQMQFWLLKEKVITDWILI